MSTKRARLLWVFVIAASIGRVALLGATWHVYDMMIFRTWMEALATHGPEGFYAMDLAGTQDHLPGDMALLWMTGDLLSSPIVPFPMTSTSIVVALKLVAFAFGLLLGLAIYRIARVHRPEVGLPQILAVTIANPAVLMVSAVWGQWDIVSIAVAICAISLLFRDQAVPAFGLVALAVIIKPQMLLIAPFMGIYLLRAGASLNGSAGYDWKRWLKQIAAGCAAAVGVVSLVGFPFRVGLLPFGAMHWSYLDRIRTAHDVYPYTTLGAFNLWILPIGRGGPPVDTSEIWSGISYAQVGYGLFAMAYVLAMVIAFRHGGNAEGLALGATLAFMAQFLFLTRGHERYLFPAMVAACLLWAINSRYWWLMLGLSVTVFADVYLAFFRDWSGFLQMGMLQQDWTVRVVAIANLALFGALMRTQFEGAREYDRAMAVA